MIDYRVDYRAGLKMPNGIFFANAKLAYARIPPDGEHDGGSYGTI